MDEITIEDKKYISTKRAAKLTGYAKDYVGQLCREGQVPARLVGRNWYVLESALNDHRFGKDEPLPAVRQPEHEGRISALPDAWQSPRYESVSVNELPTLNRLAEAHTEPDASEPAQHTLRNEAAAVSLRDAWEEWFNIERGQPEKPREEPPASDLNEEVPLVKISSGTQKSASEIAIPIRIHQQELDPLERQHESRAEPTAIAAPQPLPHEYKQSLAHRKHRGNSAIAVTSVIMALFATGFAVIGSGYLDSYVASVQPARIIAGISLYNK